MLYNSHNLTSVICWYTVYSIWRIDRTLSGTTTTGQSGPGSNGNKGVLCISQISKAGAWPSDSLESYCGHLLVGGINPSAEKLSVYSTALVTQLMIKQFYLVGCLFVFYGISTQLNFKYSYLTQIVLFATVKWFPIK